MTEEDFLVFLSYSGATKDNIYTAKIARQAGAGIGCITRFQKSPLSAYCDVVLQCGANEDLWRVALYLQRSDRCTL